MRLRLSARDDDGFTLIELMVVIIIIGVLLAVAIPTFFLARNRAQDRAAQSSLKTVVTAAKAVAAHTSDYSAAVADTNGDGVPADELANDEPALYFVAPETTSDEPTKISVTADSTPGGLRATRVVAAAESESGACWYVQEVMHSGVSAGMRWVRDDDATDCTADQAAALPHYDPAWSTKPGTAPDLDFP